MSSNMHGGFCVGWKVEQREGGVEEKQPERGDPEPERWCLASVGYKAGFLWERVENEVFYR